MNESNVKGKVDEVVGKVKQGFGEAIGNEKMANEGAADQVKGHANQAWGNVKDTAADLGNSSRTDADLKAHDAKLHAEETGHDVRSSVTSAAERTKDSINRGLDHLKGNS